MTFTHQAIDLIKQIPKRRVATYGQIAALCGSPRASRTVGWILAASAEQLPWQRVINSKGRISIANAGYPAQLQADLLKDDGVIVREKRGSYYINLTEYLWQV